MDASDGGAGAGAAAGVPDEADAAFFSRGRYRCCCFSAPWQSSSTYARRAVGTDGEWWHQVGEGGAGARGVAGAERRRWWRRGVDALMKVREWSELVAGPRWKTFIRRFRRGHHLRHGSGGGRKLNYDALSYALNFDEGPCSPEDGTGGGADYPDFSARFVGSAKTSLDLGARDAPSLLHHHHPPPHAPPAVAATARG